MNRNSQPHLNKVRERVVAVMKQLIADEKVSSRTAFAAIVKATPPVVNRWENGTGYPTFDNVINILVSFPEISPYDLLPIRRKGSDPKDILSRISKAESRLHALEKQLENYGKKNGKSDREKDGIKRNKAV